MDDPTRKQRLKRRLDRQFDAVSRIVPPARRIVTALRRPRVAILRIPAGVILVLGSFLAILPVFGVWMLPVGLLLLSVDVPALRPAITTALVRLRRSASLLRRRLR